MTINKERIKHRTECIPGLVRQETYEYGDILYTEHYDEEAGKLITGNVKMYNGVDVCTVYPNGQIYLKIPTGLATNHNGVMLLIEDIQRLDEFLSTVVENYK